MPSTWALYRLLPYQSNGDITNNLQTLRAQLVDRVFVRVMIRKIKVDHIDRPNSRLLQRHVVIDERLTGAGLEDSSVAEPLRGLPYALNHLRSVGHRVPFLLKLQILVAHHVEQDAEQRCVSRRLVLREVARADQRLGRVVEIAEVLSVHKQQVHTHG